MTTLASPRLANLVRYGAARAAALRTERCEMCGAGLADEHRHILDVSARRPLCACRACAVLFDRDAAGGDHFRLIPDVRRRVGELVDDTVWDSLGIPVGLAYFTRTVDGDVRVVYPGPAGPTEGTMADAAWAELASRDSAVAAMKPEVEGLLVHRLHDAHEQWVVPIDDCYRLVAVLRAHWTGFTGGDEVWVEVGRFFDDLTRNGAQP
ncbi:MAG: hypothetical protein JO148_01950 [Acidimicrobiia bacterium]|nr:hypothetical protein [Acidimicrobiia bacterium]